MAVAAIDPRMMDLVWTDRPEYEAVYYKRPDIVRTEAEVTSATESVPQSGLVAELEATRGYIRASLQQTTANTEETTQESLLTRASKLESSNSNLRKLVDNLTKQIERLEAKVGSAPAPVAQSAPKPVAKPAKKEESDDDDDFKFSDDEEEEAPKETSMQKMKRLAKEKKAAEEAAAKAIGHVGPITKSNVLMDVKPWDDETDIKELEKAVRAIKMDGLVWGDSKLVEIGYGIQKLRISNCIIDHLVGLYDLEDKITELEEFVQSVDIVSHNKI